MWNSFSFRYIKENRTASLLLAGAAFLSSLLLSLMTTLAYNLWMDYVKQQAAKGVTDIRPTTLFIVYGVVLALIDRRADRSGHRHSGRRWRCQWRRVGEGALRSCAEPCAWISDRLGSVQADYNFIPEYGEKKS